MAKIFFKKFIFFSILFLLAFPVFAYNPSDSLFEYQQSYLDDIDVEEAWNISKGKGVVVAVIDSGVDLDHPDLDNNIWVNLDEVDGDGIDNDQNGYIDDVYGWDFIDKDNTPVPDTSGDYNKDAIGHGTAIAGIIGAQGDGAGIVGVAFRSKIMPLRVLGSDGEGDIVDVVEAIEYAVENGADIINLSFVGYDNSSDLESTIAWASSKGVLVVASSGNDSQNLKDNPTYPACYDDVLGVSSLGNDGVRSSFSSYGSCAQISAPGENIYSTYFNDDSEDFSFKYASGLNGTSFASAIVSAVAALLKSHDLSLTPEMMISAMENTAEDVSVKNSLYSGLLGGRVNAFKALEYESVFEPRLVKLEGSSAVYYVDGDNRRHLFPTATVFWSWYQGSWSDQDIEIISQLEFENLSAGENITIRPGTDLIRFNGRETVYTVLPENKICKVKNNIFNRQAKPMPIGFEMDYTLDPDCLIKVDSDYPDSSLIQYKDSENIYYIEDGYKREITAQGFRANNFDTRFINKNVSFDISYSTGRIINSKEKLIYPY